MVRVEAKHFFISLCSVSYYTALSESTRHGLTPRNYVNHLPDIKTLVSDSSAGFRSPTGVNNASEI